MESSPDVKSHHQIYFKEIGHLEKAPKLRTFTNWITLGTKYSYLAGGGSVYILLLVAGMDLKSAIAKAPCKVAWDLGKMLRDPSCVTTGELSALTLHL
jgi:hypothetical protein